jgi:hypothetical protein
VYYAHPAIIFYTNRNPFDKQLNIEQFGFNPDNLPKKTLPTYVFWDSQFSDFSCGVKLQNLLHSNKLKLIKHEDDYGFHLYVFEVIR